MKGSDPFFARRGLVKEAASAVETALSARRTAEANFILIRREAHLLMEFVRGMHRDYRPLIFLLSSQSHQFGFQFNLDRLPMNELNLCGQRKLSLQMYRAAKHTSSPVV